MGRFLSKLRVLSFWVRYQVGELRRVLIDWLIVHCAGQEQWIYLQIIVTIHNTNDKYKYNDTDKDKDKDP